MVHPLSRGTVVAAFTLPISAFLALALTGCSTSPAGPSNAGTSSMPTHPSTTAPTSTQGSAIALDTGGRTVAGHLDNNATARSLLDHLPLTLSFRDYGGQEKIAELPAALSLDGAPQRAGADPLAIGYYSPDQRIVLYYDHVDSFAGIVPIGTFDDLDAVKNQAGNFTVTIRVIN
jgi:hypothetical protein